MRIVLQSFGLDAVAQNLFGNPHGTCNNVEVGRRPPKVASLLKCHYESERRIQLSPVTMPERKMET